jgi:hypothetical protein
MSLREAFQICLSPIRASQRNKTNEYRDRLFTFRRLDEPPFRRAVLNRSFVARKILTGL